MSERDSEVVWEDLLQSMDDGLVVPIVGQEVVLLDTGSGVVPLYRYLAKAAAERLGLSAPAENDPNPLHSLSCAQLERNGNLNDLHKTLREALRGAEALPTPEPLRQLAAIGSFNLFVSTTFDSFLTRALNEVRFDGENRTEVLEFSPFGKKDLGEDSASDMRPTVYHLFGRMPLVREYAVTEEDMLEFVHALQEESRRPPRLFEELDRRRVLLIGNGFNDWLARFFIRTAKRERLWMAQRRMDFVAESLVNAGNLRTFLRHFNATTEIFDLSPAAFIAELHRQWKARQHVPAAVAGRGELPPMRPGAVFISYASEDAGAAERLSEILRSARLDVWHDRTELQPGDPWESKLLLNIQNAAAFVPIVSQRTLTDRPRFFRVEWEHASRMQMSLPPNRNFIFPVVLDTTSPDDPAIPGALRARQWTPLEELAPGHDLLAALEANVQSFQRRTTAL